MAKVTSKLQLTVPKAVADQYDIRPGDELEWIPAGESIRVVPKKRRKGLRDKLPVKERLKLFDQATERQRLRNEQFYKEHGMPKTDAVRDWKREDLYTRGFPR
jgi:AbrB family looped-hinge helix DNA binding protein